MPASLDDVARHLFADALGRTSVQRVGLALTRGAGRELAFTASDRDHRDGVDWCTVDGLADVPLARAVRTGVPVRVPDPDALHRDFPALAEQQLDRGVRALVAYPVLRGADVVGGVLLCFDRPWSGDEEQRASDHEVVQRVAVALEQLHDRARAAALATDDRGPVRLPTDEVVQLGQHHPLTGLPDAGAHWVEAVDVGDGSFVLAAGRVPRPGPQHVRRARTALRTRVVDGERRPEALLEAVDGRATVALVEPRRRTLTVAASDGEPGVLVRAADGAVAPAGPGTGALCPDDLVVLVSEPGAVTALPGHVSPLADESSEPKLLALRVGRAARAAGSVLVARVVGPAAGRRDLVELPHSPTSPRAARRWASRLLQEWGAGDRAPEVRACVSELCTNAFMHSVTPVRVVLAREATAVVLVVHNGGVADLTAADAFDPGGVGGRGLLLVEALSDGWGWHVGSEGTTVWCRFTPWGSPDGADDAQESATSPTTPIA